MSSHNVYHVVPRDGRWAARLQGSPVVSVEADTRDEVLTEAERIIRRLGAGRIVLHGETGAIERVHTFDQIASGETVSPRGLSRPLLIGLAAGCLVALGIALASRR